MADLILSRDEIFIQKIDDLPNAGTLNEDDKIPISQNGVTKKSTISKIREGMVSEEDFADLANSEITGSLIPESHLSTSWSREGSNQGTLSTSEDVPDAHSGYSLSLTHNGVSGNANTNLIFSTIPAGVIKANQDYTFSVWAKGNVPNLSITVLLKNTVSPFQVVGSQSQVITTEWKRYSFTFTPDQNFNNCRYEIRVGNNGLVSTFFLFSPRLDRGNKPSLDFSHNFLAERVAVSSNFNVADLGKSGTHFEVTATTNTVTATLPDISISQPLTYTFRRTAGSDAAVVIQGQPGQGIDGKLFYALNEAREFVIICCTAGNTWSIVSNKVPSLLDPNALVKTYTNTEGKLNTISIGSTDAAPGSPGATVTMADREAPLSPGTNGLGVKFNHQRIFHNSFWWNGPTPSQGGNGLRISLNQDKDIMYTLMISDDAPLNQRPAVLAKVLNGDYDQQFINVANYFKAYGKPVYISIFHEFTEADWYPWGFNWVDLNGNTNDPDDFIPAFRHVVNTMRSVGGTEGIIKFEIQYTDLNNSSTRYRYKDFYPGDDYVDVVGISIYNAVGRFGTEHDRSFRDRFNEFYDQVTRFCNKPLSVSEGACHPDGYVAPQDIVITNPGSGYTSAPTVTFSASPVASFASNPNPTATATATVSGGQVTAITLVGGGYGYTSNPTITISGGGGTGATATCTITRVDRAQYYYDWFESVKDFPRLAFITHFFALDAYNGYQTPVLDYEREAFAQGYRRLSSREDTTTVNINKLIRPNLFKPWATLSSWVQSGSNPGTLALDSELPKAITNTGSSLSLTHNGTESTPSSNRLEQNIPYIDSRDNNKPHTLSFWAKIVPTTDLNVVDADIRFSTQLDGGAFQTSRTNNKVINRVWQRYELQLTHAFTEVTSNWKIRFDIGHNKKPFKLLLWGVKFEEGDFPTDYVDGLIDSLNVNSGSYLSKRSSKNGNFTVTVAEAGTHYECTPSSNMTVTLPAANSSTNPLVYTFRKTVGSTGNIVITRSGSDNILGSNIYTITEDREFVTLASNGSTTWMLVSRYIPSTESGTFTKTINFASNSTLNPNLQIMSDPGVRGCLKSFGESKIKPVASP